MGRSCCIPSTIPQESPQHCKATDHSPLLSSDVADVRPNNRLGLSAETPSLSPQNCREKKTGASNPLTRDDFCRANSVEADLEDTKNSSASCRSSLKSETLSGNNDNDTCCKRQIHSEALPSKETDSPECCRGKSLPCCNDSCLDRLALRECDANSDCLKLEDQADRESMKYAHEKTLSSLR